MIRYTHRNGTSPSDAIKIVGAKNEWEGVDAEYCLIERTFQILQKKWELLFQEFIHDNERSYDRLVLRDQDGNVSEFWFDITDWFGK